MTAGVPAASHDARGAPADPSLGDRVSALLDHAPSALVDDGHRAALAGVAAQLPAALTRGLYLECRLAAADPRVDLAVCVEDEGRRLLAAPASVGLVAALSKVDAWRAVRSLCTAWSRTASALQTHVERLWLEFDVAPGSTLAPPQPGVFVDLRPDFSALAVSRQLDVLCNALAALGADATPVERGRLGAVLRALPRGAFLFNLGLFPHRRRAFRLCIARVPSTNVRRVLRASGMDGGAHVSGAHGFAALLADADAVRAGGVHASGPPGPTLVHVDIEDEPRGRVGVEYVLRRQPQAQGALAVDPLLAMLEARGWCAAEKRAALVAWPGRAARRSPTEWVPVQMTRLVNHLKLVWHAGGVSESKAYLFGWFMRPDAA